MNNLKLKNKEIEELKPLVNQFIMRYIPEGFQDKTKIEDWLIDENNQEIFQQYMEKNNIENELLFRSLLSGLGSFKLVVNEYNLMNEKKYFFKNVFDVDRKLDNIQVELGGKSSPVEYSNIWFFGIKDNINHYVSLTGIGLALLFETELKVHEYYDSLFETLIPVPDLPDREITKEELEDYFNAQPEITDSIEEKVRVSMQKEFFNIQHEVLKNKVEKIKNQDFVIITHFKKEIEESEEIEVDDEDKNKTPYVDMNVVFSNESVAQKITVDNFFNDINNLSDQYKPETSIEQMGYEIIEETQKALKKEFEKQYQQFKNNPNLEPLNKHKKPLIIKLA